MKHFKSFVLSAIAISFAAFALGSCSGGSAKGTAQAFLDSMGSMKFDKAATYATDESKPAIAMISGFLAGMDDAAKTEYKTANASKVIRVEEDGDKATAYYTKSGQAQEEKLELVREKGAWKVSYQKEM